MIDRRVVGVILDREFRSVVRSRTLVALGGLFVLVLVALAGAATGSPGGYVSLTLDLLAPVEVLVPVLVFGVVYRSVQGDAERGELAVVRTYPVTRLEYVAGVFLGRLAGVAVLVLVALVAAGAVGGLGASEPVSILATHSAGDSPVVYARFLALALAYATAVTALALAASAAARSSSESLALATGGVLVLAVGLDLLVLGLLSGGIVGPDALGLALGLSPASAFRGLVIELAVSPAVARELPVAAASPVTSAGSLAAWTAVGLAAAAFAVWEPCARV